MCILIDAGGGGTPLTLHGTGAETMLLHAQVMRVVSDVRELLG